MNFGASIYVAIATRLFCGDYGVRCVRYDILRCGDSDNKADEYLQTTASNMRNGLCCENFLWVEVGRFHEQDVTDAGRIEGWKRKTIQADSHTQHTGRKVFVEEELSRWIKVIVIRFVLVYLF